VFISSRRTLEAQDEFVQLKAAQILTVLLRQVLVSSHLFFSPNISFTSITNSAEMTPIQHQQLQPFLETLAAFVQGTSPNKRDVGVQCLEALLARPDCRKAVWGITGIIAGSVTLLVLVESKSDGIRISSSKIGGDFET
jgi:V-type H+-transporting ATPase subunit H